MRKRSDADPAPSHNISRYCLIAIAVIFLYLLLYHYHHQNRAQGSSFNDFSTFYLAAQFAVQHKDIYTAGVNADLIYVYPPLLAVALTPLTLLSMAHAAQVALLANTLMLLGSVVLGTRVIFRRLGIESSQAFWPAVLLVCILSFSQMRSVLTMGETDALMLFMFVLGLYWLDSKPAMSGWALALALNIKYLSIVALPYLILRRRWKAAGAMVLASVFFALAPALMLGWSEDLRCLRVAMGGLLRWIGIPPVASHFIKVHDIGDDLSVSITSSIARVLHPYGAWHATIMILATGLGVACVGVITRMYRARNLELWRWPSRAAQEHQPLQALMALEWPGLVTAALAFSPDTNTRHLVMAMLVNSLAAALLLSPNRNFRRTPALVGVIVIFLAFIMPFGREAPAIGHFYYTYSIPGWGLLVGYLLILQTGLEYAAELKSPTTAEAQAAQSAPTPIDAPLSFPEVLPAVE